MNKQERRDKFLKEYPEHEYKTINKRKYPFLTVREATTVGHSTTRDKDWLKRNHIRIYKKLIKNKNGISL